MMNKVGEFLEKHVQWIALGLGALFLGYMVWIYALQTPVVATGIAALPLNPGDVDPYIRDHAATPLETAMKNPTVPEMNVPVFTDQFKKDMDFTDFPAYAMQFFPDESVIPIKVSPRSVAPAYVDQPIKALPTLPQAAIVDSCTGRSNIQPFAAGAGDAGANPPPQPAAPDGGAAVVPVAGTKDVSWVTVSYKIPHEALTKSFADAKIPTYTENTTFLEVQLWREEELPGGKWSDPKLIAPLQPLKTVPASGADPTQFTDFLTWAKTSVGDILQPAFYQVNKGDPWHAPGVTPVVQAVVLQPLDPSQTYPQSLISQYPDDQRHAYFVAHQKYLQSQRQNNTRRTPSNQGSGNTSGEPGVMNRQFNIGSNIYADDDVTDAPTEATHGTPHQGAGATARPGALGIPGLAPVASAPPIPGAAPVAGAPPVPEAGGTPPSADLAAMFPLPQGDFDPKQLSSDITGWAHDDSAEAGHTYRYMIVYRIKNPINGTNAAKPPNAALNAIFDIKSPDGAWSKPINVASTTNFFVHANSRPGADPTVRMRVYKWQNGSEKKYDFSVSPGDIIGGKEGDVDFSTGWTVVDLRFDDPHNPGSMTVLIMDPSGNLDRRDYKTDQTKPELKILEQQAQAASMVDQVAGTPK